MTLDRVDLTEYIVLSVWYGCNNDCTICMLAGLKKQMPALEFDVFGNYVNDIINDATYSNLILSGGEVTTFEDLDRYLEFASSRGWFKKIQIQTNGRRLCDKGYVQRLVDCGANEFFVSIHGLEETHDAITRTSGSFSETMEGLHNLEGLDVNVITNTVLTKANRHDVVPLMTHLCALPVSEIHLWNFYPMERTDTRDLVVSMSDFAALLGELLPVFRSSGKPLILKSFPQCLSVGEPAFFDSGYPATIIPDVFWRKFGESGFGTCFYRTQCRDRECWGLSSAYIKKYGAERTVLSPFL